MRRLIWNLNLLLWAVILVILTGVGVHEMVRGISWLEKRHLEPDPESDARVKELKDAAMDGRLEDFQQRQASMKPEAAAREWVALAASSLEIEGGGKGSPADFKKIFDVIPGPKSWPGICVGVEKFSLEKSSKPRNLIVLQSFAALLKHDPKTAVQNLDKLFSPDLPALGPQKREALMLEVFSAQTAIAEQSLAPEEILDLFKKQLARIEATHFITEMDATISFRVPDLVTLAGSKEAEDLLKRAFKAVPAPLDIPDGLETYQLAVSVGEDMSGGLNAPQTLLLDSPDSFDLYEDMLATYGPNRLWLGMSDDDTKAARKWYIFGLIARGRYNQALSEIDSFNSNFEEGFHLNSDDLSSLSDREMSMRVFKFLNACFHDPFHRNLITDPNQNLWKEYASLGKKLYQQGTMLELIDELFLNRFTTRTERRQLTYAKAKIQLNNGNIGDAINTLRSLIRENPKKNDELSVRAAALLAQIGRLRGYDDLTNEGLSEFFENYEPIRAEINSPDVEKDLSLLFRLFSEKKYDAQWENLLYRDLQITKSNLSLTHDSTAENTNARPQLRRLLEIYCRRGEWYLATNLLEHSKWWGAADLSEILDDSEPRGPLLGILAARAFHAIGEQAKALQILDAMMKNQIDCDDIGELYLEWEGPEQTLQKVNPIIHDHPLDDWPYIWKARALFQLGKYPEAYAVVSDADHLPSYDKPSETNPFMAAEKLKLALSLHLDFDDKKKDILDKQIVAIDPANKADQLEKIGLTGDAMSEFEKAHAFYPDSEFLDIRLGQLYTSQAMENRAEEIYRQAFACLPEHITGGDDRLLQTTGVLDDDYASSLALEVLQARLKKEPHDAALEYTTSRFLLRQSEGDLSPSWNLLKSTVTDDPDFYLAWAKLQDLTDSRYAPPAERMEILNAMDRLTPPDDEFDGDYEMVPDFERIWTLGNRQPSSGPDAVLPLQNSARLITLGQSINPDFHKNDQNETGGDALAGTVAVKKMLELIQDLDD